ncbi:MAG TPA: flagellar motor switch phosphatase FliY [Peptococcaceae bacterium]|nr:MAG: CheC, inhibitor of MCP methylation / FliN fusion protein [Clostridia bacterium 41_269]HBT20140.1 flagellar motor switch phosphatase FliY [Peptococcaceae bacterium]
MSENFLSQEEIDALLKQQSQENGTDGAGGGDDSNTVEEDLTQEEKDALGEIGNISMGFAATTLSELLRQRVVITTPNIKTTTQKDLFESFEKPYVVIEVNYTQGLTGTNIFFMHTNDALTIADLMMGGDGKGSGELTELHLSAVAEAMNQMMGAAATAMSNMFNFPVTISPPKINKIDFDKEKYDSPLTEEKVVVVSFKLIVGDLVDSRFMQVIPFDIAKQKARMLLDPSFINQMTAGDKTEEKPLEESAEEEKGVRAEEKAEDEELVLPQISEPEEEDLSASNRFQRTEAEAVSMSEREKRNLDLILDVPLNVSVVLGKTKKPISEVLNMTPGTIVELESLANEPVDIYVNGTLIAQGEVVVVNENFGVQIKNIISPEERIHKLR